MYSRNSCSQSARKCLHNRISKYLIGYPLSNHLHTIFNISSLIALSNGTSAMVRCWSLGKRAISIIGDVAVEDNAFSTPHIGCLLITKSSRCRAGANCSLHVSSAMSATLWRRICNNADTSRPCMKLESRTSTWVIMDPFQIKMRFHDTHASSCFSIRPAMQSCFPDNISDRSTSKFKICFGGWSPVAIVRAFATHEKSPSTLSVQSIDTDVNEGSRMLSNILAIKEALSSRWICSRWEKVNGLGIATSLWVSESVSRCRISNEGDSARIVKSSDIDILHSDMWDMLEQSRCKRTRLTSIDELKLTLQLLIWTYHKLGVIPPNNFFGMTTNGDAVSCSIANSDNDSSIGAGAKATVWRNRFIEFVSTLFTSRHRMREISASVRCMAESRTQG